jgi:hypothetical protein
MSSHEQRSEIPGALPQTTPWYLSLLSAGLPSVVVFQMTSNLLRGNSHELLVSDVPLPAIVAGCLILWLILFSVSHWGGRVGKCVWAFCCGYGVFWLVRDIIFPLPLGVLDGSVPLAAPAFGYVLAEALTFLVSFGLLLVLARRKTATVLSIFVVVLGVSDVYSARRIYRTFQNESVSRIPTESDSNSISATITRRPDIYQVLFDEYQTVEHEVLRETGGVAPYDDFICFKNNLANYNTTYFSLPSLMTSTRYDPAVDVSDWHVSYKRQGLLKVLKAFGYRIEVFGYSPSEWNFPYVDYSRCTLEIASERKSDGRSSLFAELLKLRVLPSFVGSRVSRRSEIKSDDSPPATDSAYYCTIKFREMVGRIKHRKAGENYVFVHMILPHGPNVMNEHGSYVGRQKGTRIGQVRLANKLTGELIAELKRLGRYDESLIIIHADTGRVADPQISQHLPYDGKDLKDVIHYPPAVDILVDGSKFPRSLVQARAQALLLIKPLHHQGYRVEGSPSQLMDIPPTIIGVLGVTQIKNLFPEGVDLFTQPSAEERVLKTYVLGWKTSPRNLINRVQEWKVSRGKFEKGQVLTLRDRHGILVPQRN